MSSKEYTLVGSFNLDVIKKRLHEAKQGYTRLEKARGKYTKEDLTLGFNEEYSLVAFNLQVTLEALIKISTSILSRISGAKADTTYKMLPVELEKFGILPSEFAKVAQEMFGYRNRLVHFYYQIEGEELYTILHDQIDDIKKFISYLEKFVERCEE
jgi:uncharacterized protein YutE (UPF0331/DUF86 family)